MHIISSNTAKLCSKFHYRVKVDVDLEQSWGLSCIAVVLVWRTSRLHVTPSYFCLPATSKYVRNRTSNRSSVLQAVFGLWFLAFQARTSNNGLCSNYETISTSPEVTGPCWAYTVYTKEILVCGWFCSSISQEITDVPNALSRKQRSCKAETRGGHCPGQRRWCAHFNTQKKTWVLDTTKAAASESKAVQLER